MKHTTSLCILTAILFGCDRSGQETVPATNPLDVQVVQRASLRAIALDTLSDSARILRLFPEPDGDAIAFTFADPARAITNGLGLLDLRRPTPQLVWPDSVTHVWWRAPHELAFATETGSGIRIVVDAHADTLAVLDEVADGGVPDSRSSAVNDDARARATRFIDSLRLQPASGSTSSSLQYAPTYYLPAPSDSIVAFQATAGAATSTERSNPTWYLLDPRTAVVQPLDSITGSARLMPAEAAAWTDNGSFLFAKGLTLLEARTRRIGHR